MDGKVTAGLGKTAYRQLYDFITGSKPGPAPAVFVLCIIYTIVII